jgi:predicted transcriptional regulator
MLVGFRWLRELKSQGLGATAIAKALGIGRASVSRVVEARDIAVQNLFSRH